MWSKSTYIMHGRIPLACDGHGPRLVQCRTTIVDNRKGTASRCIVESRDAEGRWTWHAATTWIRQFPRMVRARQSGKRRVFKLARALGADYVTLIEA